MIDTMLGFIPAQYYHLALLVLAAVIFHGILWARNAPFLWSQRRTILFVVLIAEVWMLVTDPIGGWWRAWYFDPNKVLGVWLFQYMPIEDLLGAAVISSAAACAILVFGYGPRKWV
ncbi:MAG: lycopene cyclase domain-containing protein [Caldilineaceae bacterium]